MRIMKKTRFLMLLAAVFTLSLVYTSCDELEGLLDDESDSSSVQAFFPKAYENKTLAAWYSWTEEDKDKTKVEAVFLFEDSTFVVTKNKVYKEDSRGFEREIEAEGTYVLTEGDYTNGKAAVVVGGGGRMMVEIKDGKLTTDQGEEVFTKQDNAKCPKAKDPAKGNDNNNNNNNNNQGNQNGDLGPFFPTAFAGKNIEAWYSYSGNMSEGGYEMSFVASLYFFGDNTFVGTTSMLMGGPNGPTPGRIISVTGKYRLQGDFTNGKVSLIFEDEETKKEVTVTAEIKDGQLVTVDVDEEGKTVTTIYIKQDNSKVPEPSDPTENGIIGGDDNQGGDIYNGDVPAFFPNAFADKKVVAWYSWGESNPYQTMVQAVFMFEDGALILTENKVFPAEIQENPERYIHAVGRYTLTGTYENGTATVILDDGRKMTMIIDKGKLIIEYNSSMMFTMRDLKDVPQPLDPTDNGNQGGDDNQGGDGDSKLAAWYTQTQVQNGREYTIAIILLDNNTIAFTRTATSSEAGTIAMTEIMAVGKYIILDGDLTNGKVMVELFGEPQEFIITNGVVTGGDGTNMEGEFIKQDNADYNGPTDYSADDGGDDGDDDGGDDDGDEYDESLFKAYLPADYASSNIAAWYMYAEEEENSRRIEAVFLFKDNTLIVTKTKIYAKNDGRKPDYSVTAKGQYRLTEDSDYENGTASVITADGQSFEVVIEDGLLTAMETNFVMFPNELLSIMTTNGK